MGDTDETTDTDTSDTSDTSDNDTSDDTAEDESDTSQNNDDKDDASASDDGKDKGKGDSQETDTADDDTEGEADDGEAPELRKPKSGDSNAKWAAWRAQEKAKKEKSGKGADPVEDTEDSDDDDGLSPEDKAKFDKRIEKQLAPFKQKAAEQEVDTEIASFLANNPDFKPFEVKARRWALHPNREGVPVKAIFFEVAGDKLLALGAQRAKAADQKANKVKTTGGQPAGNKGSQSFKDMPLSDFGKELEAAKLRR